VTIYVGEVVLGRQLTRLQPLPDLLHAGRIARRDYESIGCARCASIRSTVFAASRWRMYAAT
jgi:hypothetical protein